MNEKLILETLANHTERIVILQENFAGMLALIESRLPNLSPEQRATLQNQTKTWMSDSEALKSALEPLRESLKKL